MKEELITQEQMNNLVQKMIEKGIKYGFITLAANIRKLDEMTVQQYNGFLAIFKQLNDVEILDDK